MKLTKTTYFTACSAIKSFYNQHVLSFLLFCFFSITFFGTSFSQSKGENSWMLVNSKEGIEVYSQITSCETEGSSVPFDYLVFKVVNPNSKSIKVSLQFELYFEECDVCGGNDERSTEISLDAGETIEASCSNFEDGLCYFLRDPNFKESRHYTHSKVLITSIK